MDLNGLLNHLEDRLRDQAVPIVDVLAPGIEAEQVIAGLKPLGMRPSEELLAWFGWHNGIVPEQPQGFGQTLFNWELLSLDEAVGAWHWQRPGPEVWDWKPTWLPIAKSSGMPWMASECTASGALTGAVRLASPDEGYFDEVQRPSVPTLTTAVSWWIEALDRGWRRWAASPGEWDSSHRNDMPMNRRITGIV